MRRSGAFQRRTTYFLWLGAIVIYKNGKIVHDSGSGPIRLNDGKAGNSGRRKICFVDWDGDGRKDLIVDSRNACWFRNVKDEDGKTWLEYKGNVAERRLAGHSTCPTPVDWNRDGIYDLILGAEDGHFYYIKNPLGSK
ncbi:MAG: VCBS repeat-containing protein [Bacteroidales bacterium]|nr:VCBS repeat-containing protein [Bacteroidales bacterium]